MKPKTKLFLIFNIFSLFFLFNSNLAARNKISITKKTQNQINIYVQIINRSNYDKVHELKKNIKNDINQVSDINVIFAQDDDGNKKTQKERSDINYFLNITIKSNNNKNEFYYKMVNSMHKQKLHQKEEIEVINNNKDSSYAAHEISDYIYKNINQESSLFDTKIAFIKLEQIIKNKKQKLKYNLVIADYQGKNHQTIFSSTEPIMKPSWSPNGDHVLYTSFEYGKAMIFEQNIYNGNKRILLPSFKYSNNGPQYSPDGSFVSFTVSRKGHSNIYILNTESKEITNITRNKNINVESSWTPDGTGIIFTSNKTGVAQIYLKNILSKNKEKLISNKVRPNFSGLITPNNLQLLHITKKRKDYKLAITNLENKKTKLLTNNSTDESPSISPDGSMVVFSTRSTKGRSMLIIMSIEGRVVQAISDRNGYLRSPDWSKKPN